MWALPTVSNLNAENLPGWLNEPHLWCLLLFPRADETTLAGLKHNWDRFSAALGHSAHVVTLLDSADPNSGRGLRFPDNYEQQVGRFCHDLKIRLDHLPAIVLLNASDGREPPYFSLRRSSAKLGSDALETFVSEICASTYDLPWDFEPEAWRVAAMRKLIHALSAKPEWKCERIPPNDLIKLTQRLLRALKGH